MTRKKSVSQRPSAETSVLNTDLYQAVRQLLLAAREQVRQTVNAAMVQTYWQIGQKIVEDEQGGLKRAAYGKQILQDLSRRLSEEFGAGFDVSNLRNMRQFYLHFPIRDALRRELSWSYYRSLIRIENASARDWYAREAADQGWSGRALTGPRWGSSSALSAMPPWPSTPSWLTSPNSLPANTKPSCLPRLSCKPSWSETAPCLN